MDNETLYDAAIIGGGLAGLALSIQLSKKGYRVILFEKEQYPFHKVCGEYISMESWDFIESLGLPLSSFHLPIIKKLIVTSPNGNELKTDLPLGGFGISRYFLDNISHGTYPLWNPDYSGGVPWNFFLRRMGEFNPFYWIISGLKFLGVGALHAHLIFFVLYYFLGLVGFWLLARLFLKDRLTSTCAYLLMLFSWGGQLFYCFDVLMRAKC